MIELDIEIQKKEIKEKKKFKPVRFFSCCIVPILLLIGGGIYLFHLYSNYSKINQAKVQVEISKDIHKDQNGIYLSGDNSQSGNEAQQYRLEHASVPFAQTKWKDIRDMIHEFGFTYPVNTAAISENADDTQVWFLRGNGYMLYISIYQSKDNADAWYKSQQSSLDQYAASPGTLGKQKGLLLQLINTTGIEFPGSEYIISYKGYVFVIWYEIFDPNQNPDDAARINYMLQNFVFL